MATRRKNYGWIRDDAAVEAVQQSLGRKAFGENVSVAGESLKGYGRRQIDRGNHGVFTHLSGLAFNGGKFRDAFYQELGICVGDGTARAIEDSWLSAIAQKGVRGRPALVDPVSIYVGSRMQSDLGNGRFGNDDGSTGAWAAKWVHDHGAVEAKKYGQYDLSLIRPKGAPGVMPNEDLAYSLSKRGGRGVPKPILYAADSITIDCFFCRTGEDMLDAAYAEYAMAFCHDYSFGAKNADGISRLSMPANHCTEVLSAAVTKGGEPLIGGQQSWGNNQPRGPKVLRYRDGEVPLRPGMCFVPLEDFDRALRNGAECWAFQVVEGWR